MDTLLIEQLKELLKTYTIAATVARATGSSADTNRAMEVLADINRIRMTLLRNAESRDMFWLQQNVDAAPNAQTIRNYYITKSDRAFTFTRGIANFDPTVTLRMLNQGSRDVDITRDATAWQHLFSGFQLAAPVAQQIPFDFPEPLGFSENQTLGVAVQGQTTATTGKMIFHGAAIKSGVPDEYINKLRREFLTDTNETKYVPQTQIVPLAFKFANEATNDPAVNENGGNSILSEKNKRSVLLTHVATTTIDMRVTLSDEGRNVTFCEDVEIGGIAGREDSQYAVYYPLPCPHLLRSGDRLRLKGLNASLVTGADVPANELQYVVFKGITL